MGSYYVTISLIGIKLRTHLPPKCPSTGIKAMDHHMWQ